jgi:adenine-specific DNA-methyltransferase
MNKKDLVAKLKQLEGLTPEERAELVNLLNTKKKYGLIWEDKPEDVEEQLRTKLPVLREVVEKRILATKSESETATPKAIKTNLFTEVENQGSDNGLLSEVEAPNHILIEGDNLHALTALTFTHENKIDVIYIDPPYNTGNKDFKYNDAFVDKEDSYRHSKWLSFMHKRLEIAKRLLSDKGVVFISIDDNEQAQLKLLCDEVFGEGNFISMIIWQKKTGASDAKTIDTITEYVLVITKSLDFQTEIFKRNVESYDLNRYKYKDEFFDERGPYYLDTLDRGGLRYSDSLNYPIVCPDGTLCYPNGRTEFINDGWTFKWGQEKVKWGLENKFIDFRKAEKKYSGWTVCYKNYLYVDNEGNQIERSAPLKNMIVDIKNADGAANIKDIFGHQLFKYSKPMKLIYRILNYIEDKNIIIIDFFAGSGTTLHATMQLNAEDGGNRQCILVTNNENNICEEVTYERNKRVIQGYTNAKGVKVDGLMNNNLRYYQSEYVGREHTHKNKKELVLAATELLCIKEDIYTELAELNGQKLDNKVVRCFSDKGKYMLVIYDEEAIETLLPLISAIKSHKKIKIYIFAPGQYPFTEEFEDVLDKVELCALPDAIYKAYANVLPKKKAKPTIDESDEESTESETSKSLEPNLFTEK